MNDDILKECDYIMSDGGYIGYSWLHSLFCCQEYEGINLNVFHALFPNISKVQVVNLSLIESSFLNAIYKFIEEEKSKIYYFELGISEEYGFSNIYEQCTNFKLKFQNIGFTLSGMKHPRYQTQIIVISSH